LLICAAVPIAWAADQQLITNNGPLKLSLKRAVELALSPEGNTAIQLEAESVKQAKDRSNEARASLLPTLDAYATQTNSVHSLAGLGFGSIQLPFGIKLPTVAGPYEISDLRVTSSQTIFDLSAIRRFQSARTAVRATKSEQENAGNQVSTQVAKAYLAALRADAHLEAANADVALAQAILTQAQNQKAAGTGLGIDVTRAKVQLSDQTQRLLEARTDSRKAHLQLARAIGLRLDTEIQLTDKLEYVPVEPMTVEQAKAEAFKSRADFKAQLQHETSAGQGASAVKFERVPTLGFFGDYGTTGQDNLALQPTRDVGVTLRVPIVDGGRRDARRAEQASIYHQEVVRSNDLRQQIDLDVRVALDSLHSADEQVKVAQEGLTEADNEMTQARRRYDAGITNGIEINDAQNQLEHARDNQILALFNYNLARFDLGEALGTVRRFIQ
jgi:outer membrane protein TolC